ncbi:MAG TPA: SDR family oxidoreductase [Tepidisphaeraceae bacterium]|jgi:pteridine reductase|nr:SDR family oxidoreductase [Tepidisphaeraceae bacterium]
MTPAKPVALVTGGAKRVGRAIVERLAAEGFNIAFTYHGSTAAAAELVATLTNHGTTALAIQCDLTDPDPATAEIATRITAHFARLDVLVNNASLYEPSDLSHATLAQLRRFQAIHVESPLLLCQRLAALLRAGDGGHIINMVDVLAERPWPQYLAYCTTKAALVNLTLGLARELAPQVTVNGIAPGVVEWPPGYPEDEKQKYLQRVPLARPGTSTDVAELIAFLVTRGTYITGQIIRLDGGRMLT